MDDKKNISVKSNAECSGCTLCMNVCPTQAITMTSDTLGFKYPKVSEDLCINCGICLKKCPFSTPIPLNFEQQYFALRHSDESELLKSQSGAAFVIFSDYILSINGIIYGAAFGDGFSVIHKRATNSHERDELRYSKYIQSDLGFCFKQVLEDLKLGKAVLFTGTPCQVAGIKEYIPKKWQENLYLIDLICHGVPSPAIWNDYVQYIEKKYGTIQNAYFRDKRFGWNVQKETFKCSKERSFITFKKLFYSNVCLRESCYECPFTNYNRVSDLTIGDFWGIERVPEIANDNRGMSLILVNTEKALSLLEKARKGHFCMPIPKDKTSQPQLQYPTKYNENRPKFIEDYGKYGFKYISKVYSDLNLKTQIRYKLSKIKALLIK